MPLLAMQRPIGIPIALDAYRPPGHRNPHRLQAIVHAAVVDNRLWGGSQRRLPVVTR
jgi:hypothetical protein